MIKEVKELQTNEVTVKRTFCDDCGTEINLVIYRYSSTKCNICGKDLCGVCVANEESEGDYTDVYCNNCWNVIGEPYRKKISELENEIDQLHEEWYNKCNLNKK